MKIIKGIQNSVLRPQNDCGCDDLCGCDVNCGCHDSCGSNQYCGCDYCPDHY